MVMFLAHVAPFYPQHLSQFPQQVLELLRSKGESLQPMLRRQLTQALILLRNRQMIDLVEILPVLMELQTLGDRALRKLASLHVVQDIRRMNLKHRNESKNRALQNVLFHLLQEDNEARSKRALMVLCDLHRRKLWVDERTANAICTACFHQSSKILKATLSFLLGFEKMDEDVEDDSSEDEDEHSKPSVVLSREAVYKAHHKGTASSRKKKQAKLERVLRSLKKQKRTEAEGVDWSTSPLQQLHDPQGFAEKLFSRLQTCNERFEVKLMMMKVISRAVGLHRLILLNFYPFLQKYIQPQQHDVPHILAAAVQACHDMVPPDAVESLLRQLVNQFVHDRARPEVIAVGLNVVREMCLRMPLIMTRELLHDLAMYKKSREKAVASAARSIIAVFRQVFPSLLEKKDRGRAADLLSRPKAFGEKLVKSNVEGMELLDKESDLSESDCEDNRSGNEVSECLRTDNGIQGESEEEVEKRENDSSLETRVFERADGTDDTSEAESDEEDSTDEEGSSVCEEDISEVEYSADSKEDWGDDGKGDSEHEDDANELEHVTKKRKVDGHGGDEDGKDDSEHAVDVNELEHVTKKRRTDGHVDVQNSQLSLRELKKIAAAQKNDQLPTTSFHAHNGDGILSDKDFEHIRKLQARKAAQAALVGHGIGKAGKKKEETLKIPSSEHIHERRVNPSSLEADVRRRRDKAERVAIARAGRDERLPYTSRTSVKKKKTGGLSNRQKEKKKGMPLAAKRAKATKSRNLKAKKRSTKQFRGRKAWK